LKSLVLARVARLLGVLLEGHVGLLDALKLTKQSAGNYRYAELITHAEDAVSRGEAISVAFADVELVTPSVYEAIRNGEQSGKMGSLLLQIADFLDEDNEVIVKSLTSIIEPLILIGLGALVAFIAVSLFMPLFDLTALTGGG
jgi:type II secretory pathway component PulF